MTMFKPCSATPAGKTTYAKMYLDRILKRVR